MIEEKCIHCKTKRAYSEQYNAYYCPKCLYWLEKICPDRDCEYCKDRPKYPKGKPIKPPQEVHIYEEKRKDVKMDIKLTEEEILDGIGFKKLTEEEYNFIKENKGMIVEGLCRKCNTKQTLEIKCVGGKEICFWCPNCEDQIDRSAVEIE